MKRYYIFLLLPFIAAITVAAQVKVVHAQTPIPQKSVYIYLFYGEGCPHCAKAKPYFESLAAAHPEIILKTYEVYYDAENQRIFSLMAKKYGLSQMAVPAIFIGQYSLLGYSEDMNAGIEAVVAQLMQEGSVDPGIGVISSADAATPTPFATEGATPAPAQVVSEGSTPSPSLALSGSLDSSHDLNIPIFGNVNLDSKSTLITTVLIALVDGFNPCSLWVLTMLLALTLHTGSRKKVFIIGAVFLTVTAVIYALFIAGLFSILKITSFMGWIRIFVALIALFFALINIKDYFWYREGISFTISGEKKPGIFMKMRAVVDSSQSLAGLVGATIVLAAGVSLVEFSCTAGFPVVWTNILTLQNVGAGVFILLLIVYMFIYQLDEMIIFFSSVATLKASRLEEKHGRVLKLISGMLMLTLSVVMLFNPSLLNNLTSSLIIFGSTLLATGAILILHRILLPKVGIRIGSEVADFNKHRSSRKKNPSHH